MVWRTKYAKSVLVGRSVKHCGDTKHKRDKPVTRHFNLTTWQKISSSWPSTDQARMTPITDWPLSPSGLRNLTPSTPLVSMSKVTVKISLLRHFPPYPWSVLPVSLYFVFSFLRKSNHLGMLVRPGCPT